MASRRNLWCCQTPQGRLPPSQKRSTSPSKNTQTWVPFFLLYLFNLPLFSKSVMIFLWTELFSPCCVCVIIRHCFQAWNIHCWETTSLNLSLRSWYISIHIWICSSCFSSSESVAVRFKNIILRSKIASSECSAQSIFAAHMKVGRNFRAAVPKQFESWFTVFGSRLFRDPICVLAQ